MLYTVFAHIGPMGIFLGPLIQRSQYIRPNVSVHKCGDIIRTRELFEGGSYIRSMAVLVVEFSIRKIFG